MENIETTNQYTFLSPQEPSKQNIEKFHFMHDIPLGTFSDCIRTMAQPHYLNEWLSSYADLSCDALYNTPECLYDGGDCCLPIQVRNRDTGLERCHSNMVENFYMRKFVLPSFFS